MKPYIKRKKYLKEIETVINDDLIKVIIGQRRVGKTYLIWQIIDLIKSIDKKANCIYINKELIEYDEIRNHKDLLVFVQKNTRKTKNNYLLIDEIQEIANFEKALRSLRAKGGYDIYCTGSNAELISAEIATLFAGRYYQIEVFSLSYKEFLQFHNLAVGESSLEKFFRFGGLPYLRNLKLEDEVVFPHLEAIYHTILFKDIAERYKIRNFNFLEKLIVYLAQQTGSLISANRIGNFLKSNKFSVSLTVVLEYLEYLKRAFFIQKVNRFDIIGKKGFEINEKYYFSDLGLRHTIIGYRQSDMDRILENVIYLQLRYMGYKVEVGVLGRKEVDFVATRNNEKIYVQVAYQIHRDNMDREFGNLLEIKDNYQKIVVSANKFASRQNTYQGIEHWYVEDFLLKFK